MVIDPYELEGPQPKNVPDPAAFDHVSHGSSHAAEPQEAPVRVITPDDILDQVRANRRLAEEVAAYRERAMQQVSGEVVPVIDDAGRVVDYVPLAPPPLAAVPGNSPRCPHCGYAIHFPRYPVASPLLGPPEAWAEWCDVAARQQHVIKRYRFEQIAEHMAGLAKRFWRHVR